MNAISRLELWTGRLPIGRTIEALFAAFLCLCLAMMSGCANLAAGVTGLVHPERIAAADAPKPAPAKAAEEPLTPAEAAGGVIATCAKAITDVITAPGQQETAKSVAVASIERMCSGGGGSFMAAQFAAQQPVKKSALERIMDCNGVFSCIAATVNGGIETVERIANSNAANIAGQVRIVKVNADANKTIAAEQSRQVESREVTTRAMSGDARQIAAAGTNGVVAAATAPRPAGTQVTVSGNTGPVNVGRGTQTAGSNNPVTNPAPVVVGTTTTVVSRGP